jgi:hypothetical protein
MSDSMVSLAPTPAIASPTAMAGGGLPIAPPPASKKTPRPKKGELSIALVAAIQGVYAKEEQKQQQIAGQPATGLQPGWGGQGR